MVEYQGVDCSDCGATWSPGQSVCSRCGSQNRTHFVHASDSANATDHASFMHERREIIRKNPWVRWLLLALDLLGVGVGVFIASWLGALIGLALIAANHLFTPKTVQVITRTHG